VLAAGRVLRGTPLDVFGIAEVRRIERALASEYAAAIERVLARLSEQTFESIVSLAGLPDQVRGYENLKLTRVAAFRQALTAAESSLGGDQGFD
jgi:indolepyruvate ferredoxin oxidoreductase